ncbi:tRNA dihydrouridine(16) synthase DusC [Niveibacterium umoris]|uniref:tRNA-dihydrouridine(16) synthase n=1 Tax=Niveibacterium umoris TaxID=1193620 RepID=A0A840BG86_9RHOO|nr:tRNA-dihydrouridine synthase [Niveibacterium umoris]MBB4011204.1 tRNA-dihydrouridine synthase C [Niveibacterium umoris]
MPRLLLAPMEGMVDDLMRDVLTRVGGYDHCVTEFARVSGTVLPARCYTRISPELLNAGRTLAGTPVRVQLLGSDPACMGDNAARLATLAPPGIDLNFGCPAPTVNRHRGGAALLNEPHLLFDIAREVRAAVPRGIPFTAKMRLGIDDASRAIECAQALADGGAEELVIHARTKADRYKPPAHWAEIARVTDVVKVPVVANGEVWSVEDWRRCRSESGRSDVMLGRGAVADPFLARRIRGTAPATLAECWSELLGLLAVYWRAVLTKVEARHAPGRLKQWLFLLERNYPQAARLLAEVRPMRDAGLVEAALIRHGAPISLEAAA